MFEYALMFVIFVGVMTVTAVIFFLWLVVTIVRAMVRGVWAIAAPQSRPPLPMGARGRTCPNDKCKATNIESARFCRRCGTQLSAAQQVTARRAAMWCGISL